jgi:hypothetical protein
LERLPSNLTLLTGLCTLDLELNPMLPKRITLPFQDQFDKVQSWVLPTIQKLYSGAEARVANASQVCVCLLGCRKRSRILTLAARDVLVLICKEVLRLAQVMASHDVVEAEKQIV